MDSFLILLQARAIKARAAFDSAEAEFEASVEDASEEGRRALISSSNNARREFVTAARAASAALEEAADEFSDAKTRREVLQAAYLLAEEVLEIGDQGAAVLERLTEALADLPM